MNCRSLVRWWELCRNQFDRSRIEIAQNIFKLKRCYAFTIYEGDGISWRYFIRSILYSEFLSVSFIGLPASFVYVRLFVLCSLYWAQMCYHQTYLNALFGSSCNKSACWLRAQTNVHERFAWSIRTLNIVDVFANVSLSLVAFRELVKFTLSCNWLNTKKIRRSKNTTNFFGIILATNWVGSKFRKMKKKSKLNSSSNHTKQT